MILRESVLAAVLAVLFVTDGAAAADVPPAVEACIRENAPKVEMAIASLTEASQFLLSNVCAEPLAAVSAAEARASSARMQERWHKACEQRRAEHRSDSTNSDEHDPCAFVDLYSTDLMGGGYLNYYIQGNSAANALAAKLLLDLRLARLAREGHH